MQLLQALDAVDRARLGYELMSSYAIREGKLQGALPLFSREQLIAESSRWPKTHQDTARRTMAYILPGAESPAEINLALKLFLPMRYGGLGLKGAQLNPRIELSKESQAITGKTHCRADIFFSDIKLDVEYDSAQWHSEEGQRLDDLARRLALKRDGYDVIPIDTQTANTPAKLALLASDISTRKKIHINLNDTDFLTKQLALFERLGPSFTPVEVQRPLASPRFTVNE